MRTLRFIYVVIMGEKMKIGKLSPALLDKIVFQKIAGRVPLRREVISGAGIGEDCAVLDLGGELCVLSADPITAAESGMGRLALHVNVNDIAACGCEPVGVLVTALFPEFATEAMLERVMNDIVKTADELGVSVIGGHTEVTDAVNRPVVSVAIVGKSLDRKTIGSGGGKAGQDLVMTKWAALEGTAILADCMAEKLTPRFGEAFVREALEAGKLISVLKEARIAAMLGASAMHDITEGGVLGGCFEMAEASRVGVEVYAERVPLLDVTKRICSFFQIDPLKLISSGAMLIMTENGRLMAETLEKEGVHATVIGRVTEGEKVCVSKNGRVPISPPESDELYSVIFQND